jgi:hypothetical protein
MPSNATLGGVSFTFDPHSIQWDYTVHISDKPFIGGKVVQVYGATIGDITIEGSFGRFDGLDAQLAFLDRMKRMGSAKVDDARTPPTRFFWPEQRWDFQVYLKRYENPKGGRAIEHSPENFAPEWRLVLHPVSGTSTLQQASVTAFIERLSQGMGWRETEFQGPPSWGDLQGAMSAMGATGYEDFFSKAFGAGGVATDSGLPSGNSQQGAEVQATSDVQRTVQAMAAERGWTGSEWNALYELIMRESTWNPQAANPNSAARGLFQKMTSLHGPVEDTVEGQTLWGLNYIAGRYGTPSAALAFHDANNFY